MIRFVLLAALIVFSRSMVSAPDPETQVEISIYDLVGKTRARPRAPSRRKASSPKLPDDYGRRIAALIEASRPRLTDCLGESGGTRQAFPARLEIAPDGHAAVSLGSEGGGEEQARACLSRILSAISYPSHPLPKTVTVKFPLVLQRRAL